MVGVLPARGGWAEHGPTPQHGRHPAGLVTLPFSTDPADPARCLPEPQLNKVQNGSNPDHIPALAGIRWVSKDSTPTCAMAYEPGTSECRLLIDSKAQIESALLNLAKLENTEAIRAQLVDVYNQLEARHERRRALRQPVVAA